MRDGPVLRPVAVQARAELARGRERLREQHAQGSPGIEVCSHLTDLLDSVVLRLYEAALEEIGDRALESSVALVAHGGYGRRDVAPYSDVDLMLLTTPDAERQATQVSKRLTPWICDAGLKLGLSFRTPAECCAMALRDATVLTSVAESRLLAGSVAVFRSFTTRFRRCTQRHWRTLLETIVRSRRAERLKYGETVYLLEPNIKRSRGGLRDVQLVRWVGFARYGQAELESLYRLGMFSQADWLRLRQAHEFLLRVRNELHFHAGKSQDLMTRPEQVRLAELYDYCGSAGVLPVEQFMRDYFERTSDVRHISAHFVATVQTRSRWVTALAPLFTHQMERDFRVGRVHIGTTRRGLRKVTSDLAHVLRLMELANLHRKRIDHPTWEAIREAAAKRRDDAISAETVQRFLALLGQPGRLGDLLRRLHELRVLERIIPAMQHARCLVQWNDYHKYTIDEHVLRSVESATNLLDDPSPVGVAYRQLRDKTLLHLALLLHDLGKGYDEDHSEVGGRIAGDTARRLNLGPRDTEVLRFLVRKHLLMSHVALRQDLHDESTVVRFAVEVGSPHVLQMLYILSCADLAAVGPGVLNNWKLELLTELYYRAGQHLTGEDWSQNIKRLAEQRRQAVRGLVPTSPVDPWWHEQIDALPSNFLLNDPPDRVYAMLDALRRLSPTEVATWSRYMPDRKVTIYQVGTHEEITPGVFHKLTGALTGKGVEILAAEIHTLAAGLVCDRFIVNDTDHAGQPPPERAAQICAALVHALTTGADQPPTFRRLWTADTSSSAADYRQLPTQVRFDDTTSPRYTIITIFTYDRRGLLYEISRTLFALGLSVHVARIATYLDQVVDVFYVTDYRGKKIYDDPWRAEIRRQLTDALGNTSP